MDLAATDSAYYHAVADLYDDMKANDNYEQFAELLMPLLLRWSVPGRRLLDVGCGTGASSIMFAERGFDVVGCDESTQMLEIARQKLSDRGIAFLRADMRELPEELAGFDVVAWIDDVANHLLTDDDLRTAFTGQSHSAMAMARDHRAAVVSRVCAGIERPTTRRVEVGWFGGEPLAGLAVIRDLSCTFINVADRKGVSYTAKMPTNGSLLTVDKVRILLEECRVTHLEVTLDGPAEVHNRHRPLKSGKGSFHHIVDVLQQALQTDGLEGMRFSLRTNVDMDDCDYIPEYIEYMAGRRAFADKRVSFYFAPVHSWSNDVSAIQLGQQVFATLEAGWLREMSSRGLNIPTLPSEPKDVVCKAVTPFGEVVSSSGRVFSCSELPLVPTEENDASALGRVDDPALPAIRPLGPFDGWHDSVERHETPCGECVFFPTCGGSCPKLWAAGYEPCPSYKFNINQMFDLVAIQSGLVPVSPERVVLATLPAHVADQ